MSTLPEQPERTVVLEVRGLSVNYGKVEALHGLALKVHRGEIVTVIGPNGAGKTTLLSALIGLLPVRGEIVYLGDAVNVAKRLETEAGARRARLLVSGDVVAGLRDAGLRARLADLGEIPIAGRAAPLRTYVAEI